MKKKLRKFYSWVINLYRELPSKLLTYYYKGFVPTKTLGMNKCEKEVIVSLTSYPARFPMLPLCIKSLMNQTLTPDRLIVYLATEENFPTTELIELKKLGMEIRVIQENLKPHNKYYYAIKEFPDSIIITVDDDMIYSKKLVEKLLDSYTKYPNCISAFRVHRMAFDNKNKIKPYDEWDYDFTKDYKPSMRLLATGTGGVLYPPHSLPTEVFNILNIKKYCLTQDDIWLKYMEIINGIKVVRVISKRNQSRLIYEAQKVEGTLYQMNLKEDNRNDRAIAGLAKEYGIDLYEVCKQ